MKRYGIPRHQDLEYPDRSTGGRFGIKGIKCRVRARVRRYFKHAARGQSKREVLRWDS